MTGKIVKGIAGFYSVYVSGKGTYECKAKGIFRNRSEKPLVGDSVELSIIDEEEKTGSIEKIFPRTNSLVRPEVANVDQVMVVFALADPEPNLHLLDCLLVRMEKNNVPVFVCFNKTDIITNNEYIDRMAQIYRQASYDVMTVSTVTKEGLDELRIKLDCKTTVLAGPSGVGKSSLMNMLCPEAGMTTGEISRKLKRGKHTTRHSEIFCIGEDTYLMDTPGFSSLRLPIMEVQELKECFPEYVKYEGQCRFNGCIHVNEPECAVKSALDEGKLTKERYESYLLMNTELESVRRTRKWK